LTPPRVYTIIALPHFIFRMEATVRSAPKRIPFLDDIRGIAIIAVFLFHCVKRALGHNLTPATFGGVAMFFVLSGFCIHLACRGGKGKSWREFYRGRFFRLYPAYVAALFVFAFIFPTTRLHFEWGAVKQLASHLLLIHNLHPASFFSINAALWSIAVEAQFYLLYPLLLALAARLGWSNVLWLLAAVALALRVSAGFEVAAGHYRASLLDGLPFYHWFSWALGAAAADAYLNTRKMPLANFPAAMWLVAAVATSIIRPLAPLAFLFFSVFTAAAIARLLAAGRAEIPALPGFLSRHLKFIAARSYSFYLIHLPLVMAVPRALDALGFDAIPPPTLLALMLALYPPILGLAALFRKYVELPSAAWGKSSSRREGIAADQSTGIFLRSKSGGETAGLES
jgi:peptidoglycan/LPS O-acetylase OafA/YrhL